MRAVPFEDGYRGRRQSGSATYACAAFLVLGTIASMMLTERLIVAWPDRYSNLPGLLFALLFLVLLLVFSLNKSFNASIDFPTRWIRWFFVKPMLAALAAGMLMAAPLGWIGVAKWVSGHESTVLGQILELNEYRAKKGCDQHATLKLPLAIKRIFPSAHIDGGALMAGQEVDVKLHGTGFVVIIGNITPRSSSK